MSTETAPLELPRPHPSVLFRAVSDGAVLLHTEEEIYFGLNPVGRRIWQLLPPRSGDLDELVEELKEFYVDVDRSTLRADVLELLDALDEAGLVVGSD